MTLHSTHIFLVVVFLDDLDLATHDLNRITQYQCKDHKAGRKAKLQVAFTLVSFDSVQTLHVLHTWRQLCTNFLPWPWLVFNVDNNNCLQVCFLFENNLVGSFKLLLKTFSKLYTFMAVLVTLIRFQDHSSVRKLKLIIAFFAMFYLAKSRNLVTASAASQDTIMNRMLTGT